MENIQCYAKIHVQEGRKQPWTILAIVQLFQQIPLLLHALTLQAGVSLSMVEKSVEKEEWKKYAPLVYCFLWQTRNKFLKSREKEKKETEEQVGLFGFFFFPGGDEIFGCKLIWDFMSMKIFSKNVSLSKRKLLVF